MINFFYTNCPTAQTSLSTLFRVQQSLGDALGKEVVLLSLSVDPERDTVEAVRKYAGKFNPRKGWTFVTGKPQNIEAINLKLGSKSDQGLHTGLSHGQSCDRAMDAAARNRPYRKSH